MWRSAAKACCLYTNLELPLVQVLSLLHLPVLVAHLCLSVLKLFFGNLPEGIDLVLQPYE